MTHNIRESVLRAFFSFDGVAIKREANMNHRHQGGSMVSVPGRGLMIIGTVN